MFGLLLLSLGGSLIVGIADVLKKVEGLTEVRNTKPYPVLISSKGELTVLMLKKHQHRSLMESETVREGEYQRDSLEQLGV